MTANFRTYRRPSQYPSVLYIKVRWCYVTHTYKPEVYTGSVPEVEVQGGKIYHSSGHYGAVKLAVKIEPMETSKGHVRDFDCCIYQWVSISHRKAHYAHFSHLSSLKIKNKRMKEKLLRRDILDAATELYILTNKPTEWLYLDLPLPALGRYLRKCEPSVLCLQRRVVAQDLL